MTKTPHAEARTRVSDLQPGDTYYAVYTSTGRCIYRTLSKNQADSIAARDPARREVMEHTK